MTGEARLPPSTPRWRQTLDGLVSVSVVIACFAFTWSSVSGSRLAAPVAGFAGSPPSRQPQRGGQVPVLPSEPLTLDGAQVRGDPGAKIAVIEYSDFQCPYCGVFFRNTLPRIDKEYLQTGRVKLAFRQLPLESLHPFAMRAAEATECAGRQHKFWDLHDVLFKNQQQLDEQSLRGYASAIGLDGAAFGSCLSGDATGKVRTDIQGATKLNVTGTPTFFIGLVQADGRVKATARFSGAATFERFQAEFVKLVPGPTAGQR